MIEDETLPLAASQINEELLREFCQLMGVDIDKPMEKVVRWVSFEEKNRQHEEWHLAFEKFLATK